MLDSTKKRYPTSRAKAKPQHDGRRGEITFRIKPHTHQRLLEGPTKMLYAPGPRGPTETEPDLPLIVWVSPVEARVSSGLMQEQGLWLQQTCPRSMWHKPSWRRSPLAPSYSHWADNPQMAKQLYQRNSHTVKKVLGHTTDFPTRDLTKRLRTLSEFELEASWIWLQNFYRTGETDSWRA